MGSLVANHLKKQSEMILFLGHSGYDPHLLAFTLLCSLFHVSKSGLCDQQNTQE